MGKSQRSGPPSGSRPREIHSILSIPTIPSIPPSPFCLWSLSNAFVSLSRWLLPVVLDDAVADRLADGLLVARVRELLFVAVGIDVADLEQHRRHGGAADDGEAAAADAAVTAA